MAVLGGGSGLGFASCDFMLPCSNKVFCALIILVVAVYAIEDKTFRGLATLGWILHLIMASHRPLIYPFVI